MVFPQCLTVNKTLHIIQNLSYIIVKMVFLTAICHTSDSKIAQSLLSLQPLPNLPDKGLLPCHYI